MKILLVAGMVNTQNAFRPLAEKLKAGGHEVVTACGTSAMDQVALEASETLRDGRIGLVVSGMAAPAEHASLENMVLTAAEAKRVPFLLYSDASGGYKSRPWFDALRAKAAGLLVRYEREVADARALNPGLRIVEAVGHPGDEISKPKYTRTETRKLLGLGKSDAAVFLSGTKSMKLNELAIRLVDTAFSLGSAKPTTKFLYGPHPGVTGPKAGNKEIPFSAYEALSPRLRVVDPSLGRADDLMPGFDVFLFTSGTTYNAALRDGVPAVLLNSPELAAIRDTDLSHELGTGVIFPVASSRALADLARCREVGVVLAANGRVYRDPPREPGTCAARMAEVVSRLASMGGARIAALETPAA